jgi:hypothetical protein
MATEIYPPPQLLSGSKIYSPPTDATGSTTYEDPNKVVFVGDAQLVGQDVSIVNTS